MNNAPPTAPPPKFQNAADALNGLTGLFQEAMDTHDVERDAFWEGLTPNQRLLAFCSVVKRLSQAELVDGLSYRGVLYEAFGFDMQAYVLAQHNGFLELHNALPPPNQKAPPAQDD